MTHDVVAFDRIYLIASEMIEKIRKRLVMLLFSYRWIIVSFFVCFGDSSVVCHGRKPTTNRGDERWNLTCLHVVSYGERLSLALFRKEISRGDLEWYFVIVGCIMCYESIYIDSSMDIIVIAI